MNAAIPTPEVNAVCGLRVAEAALTSAFKKYPDKDCRHPHIKRRVLALYFALEKRLALLDVDSDRDEYVRYVKSLLGEGGRGVKEVKPVPEKYVL